MNKEKIREFLSDPAVKEIMKIGGVTQLALVALSLGNISRDPDLRKFSNLLTERGGKLTLDDFKVISNPQTPLAKTGKTV